MRQLFKISAVAEKAATSARAVRSAMAVRAARVAVAVMMAMVVVTAAAGCENHNRVGKEGSTGDGGVIDSEGHYDTSRPQKDSVGNGNDNPNGPDTGARPQKPVTFRTDSTPTKR